MQISRKFYFDSIKPYVNKPIIKIITGQRRVGKTMFLEELATLFKDKEVLYISMENKDFSFLKTDDDLNEFLEKEIKEWKKYIFIDEIQYIKSWEKTIDSVFVKYKEKIDIYITGSNSSLLTGELATLLTGRYIKFQIFPFSYEEFLEYFEKPVWSKSFTDYMETWWLAIAYLTEDKKIITDVISSIIDTIIVKDLIPRYGIRDIALLKELFIFLVDNIWKITNITNIVNYMTSHKIETNINTISSYIEILKTAYLIYEANLLDLKGKRIFDRDRKFYIWDHIFRKIYFSENKSWFWNTLENIVYLASIKAGYNVFVWKLWDKEIDFVLEKKWIKKYFQVCYILSDDEVIEREFWNLEKIKDNWEKYVVSMDELDFWVRNGIKHIKIWEIEKYL